MMNHEARQSRFAPPAGAAELFLVRHGESMPALRGEDFPLKDGHGDPALHPDGEAQARAVGQRLRNSNIAAIYVTTLQRTHQTAAPLAAALGLEPRIEADLREVCLGEWDGGAYRFHATEKHPAYLQAMQRHEWGEIPGAETTDALHMRVRRGLLRIAAAHPDSRVAVFVHGGVIGAAMSIATGAKPFAFNRADNGSISLLVIHGETMIARRFNDTTHLE
ncbi:histidine phosphatase family protein [Paracoccus onubensis]|uniref:histidine phosphatase family protein n=1 Tax=Paracoccus onubensis TaxID=1675788 RepID=UPI0027302DEB|nr:histidine phosphatase family protein [Paracoccus onubensis]MDP0928203.1 histidine phosphatase family protein [Paracoccus onubensis]